MFRMTCSIKIGPFKPFKPNAVKWSRSVGTYNDTAVIKLPAVSMLKTAGDIYERVQTGLQIQEGMPVEIYCGYNGRNALRFRGFVRRVNFSIPLEVECEGYSYQLRKKLGFTKSYGATTVRQILTDLTAGTDIKLSAAIPDVPLPKAVFKNCSGIQVLEWLKDKCLLTVYFNGNELYAGGLQLEPKGAVKFRLGWNTVKDSELKFNDKKELADVRIELQHREKSGKKQKAVAGDSKGQTKTMKSAIADPATRARIAEQKRKELVNAGYEGAVTAFLEPVFEPGMAVHIEDHKYPERKGGYFGMGVEGEFSKSGGRQKIKIGYSLGNG